MFKFLRVPEARHYIAELLRGNKKRPPGIRSSKQKLEFHKRQRRLIEAGAWVGVVDEWVKRKWDVPFRTIYEVIDYVAGICEVPAEELRNWWKVGRFQARRPKRPRRQN